MEQILDWSIQLLGLTSDMDGIPEVEQGSRRAGMTTAQRIIWGIAIAFTVSNLIAGGYITLWAWEGWGWVDFQWLRDFLGIFASWSEQLFLIDLVAVPLDFVKELELAIRANEKFKPSNGGFVIYYQLTIFPLLWLLMNEMAPVALLIVPWLGFFYNMDKTLFIDEEWSH